MTTETEMKLKALEDAVRKVHQAKGRYHSQIAMCDLYDLLGLKNTRPVSGEKQ